MFHDNSAAGSAGGAIWAKNNVIIGTDSSFERNTAGNNGGAIYSDIGNILVGTGSNFLNNKTTGGDGGAIRSAGTVTILSNATSAQTFVSNVAGAFGGAIYAEGAVIIGGNTTFGGTNIIDGNTAVAHGGAIYSNTGAVTVGNDTDFLNNKGGWGSGGAIYGAAGTVTGTNNLTFTGNTTGNQGGAIYAATGVTIGTDSTFTNNAANGWGGGAIFSQTGDISIGTGATFLGNTTLHAGGAINALGASIAKDGIVTIGANSTFGGLGLGEGNTSVDNGGAIYALEAFIGANASFIGNASSAGLGGAIYVYGWDDRAGTSLLFNGDVTATKNTALKGQLQHAGELYNYYYDWTYGSGGAVYVEFGDIEFRGAATFENNTAAVLFTPKSMIEGYGGTEII